MNEKQALENIKQIMLSYAEDDKADISPSEILIGTGSAWFYDPVNKTMELVRRGEKVVRNPSYVDHKNRILSCLNKAS